MAGEGSSWFPAQALYCPNQSGLQSAVWCIALLCQLFTCKTWEFCQNPKFVSHIFQCGKPLRDGWRGCININIEESNLQLPKCITERLIMWFICEVAFCGPQPFLFQNSLHIHFFTNVFGCHLCSHKATCPVALETFPIPTTLSLTTRSQD